MSMQVAKPRWRTSHPVETQVYTSSTLRWQTMYIPRLRPEHANHLAARGASFLLPGRLPLTGFGGVEDGLDDSHVLDGVFDGNGDFSVLQNSLGEGVGLQGVLLADGKGLRRDTAAEEVAPVVDEEARGAVGRRVEGDFHLDAPTGAEKLDALVGDQLRAAS